MVMNLFSVFDPVSYFGISFNWIIVLIVYMLIPSKHFIVKSEYKSVFIMANNNLKKMFNEVAFPNHSALVMLSMVVFLYFAVSNLMGLFPFIFTSTAHPVLTMSMGMLLWAAFFLMGWCTNFKACAAHLVPEGSPFMLAPLMVLIESISHLIRPFTLSVRLAANMMAGHLIIGLLASISMLSVWSGISSLILQSTLLILELGVAIIQGFVFSILLMLYALEYY